MDSKRALNTAVKRAETNLSKKMQSSLGLSKLTAVKPTEADKVSQSSLGLNALMLNATKPPSTESGATRANKHPGAGDKVDEVKEPESAGIGN